MDKTLIKQAHQHSYNNKAELEKSKKCGCFYCEEIYDAKEVCDWVYKGMGDEKDTALCPKCGIDSVIGDASGIDITPEFLKEMYEYWFENSDEAYSEEDE